ncbi:MAG: hypothetical protein H0U95_11230 [Bacteroidetes bacterium]|nr:hypothetical protein [Bacteroidota bacterium]
MSKGTKEILKKLLSNTELIMTHLNIKKVAEIKDAPKKTVRKKATKRLAEKKSPGKKR